MKFVQALLVIVAAFAFSTQVSAVPAGKTAVLDSPEGKVTFDGKIHAKAAKCNDCHPKLFQMKAGANKITMAAMKTGGFCGSCHDGKKVFATDDPANCTKCHKK